MPDSPGEAAARAGLKTSVERNRTEVALAGETIDLLRDEIRIGLKEGIREGLTTALDEKNAELLFSAFVKALQKQAQVKTGRWVLDGIGTGVNRLFWLALGAWAIYSIGGWAAIKLAWAVAQAKGAP